MPHPTSQRILKYALHLTCLLASLLSSTLALAQPVTITLNPDLDNTLYQDDNGNFSNARGTSIVAGRTGYDPVRRAAIRFNLSTIPAGSTIQEAVVTLRLTRARSGSYPVSFHKALASWGEGTSQDNGQGGQGVFSTPGDATWIHRFYPSTLWTLPGGDFVPAVSATKSIAATLGPYQWSGNGLVADLQAWLDAPATNFGWILRGDETQLTTARRFASRESSNPPTLAITYLPPAVVQGACCMPGGMCMTATPMDCSMMGGTYQGNNTPCSPDPCMVMTGACCLPTGQCLTASDSDCMMQGGTYQGNGSMCSMVSCPIALTPFVDQLPIPPIAQPATGTPGGAAHYNLFITEQFQQLHRDLPETRVWGYQGTYPGPTIEARRGEVITVDWINNIREAESGILRTEHPLVVDTCLHGPDMTGNVPVTVTHLHGGKVDSASDGQPELTFAPGQSALTYTYPNDQPASTIWYHDHALGITRLNVYMGLAGFYLIRDDQEEALNIPRGNYEIPLLIQDRSFNPDGSLRYPDMWMEHFFGDFILVNGKVWPFTSVDRGKYRFRLLNGSGSRTYTLALSNAATLWQIGTDSSLLAAPVPLTTLTLQPGERADVIIDFAPYAPGTEIVLTNAAPSPFPGGGMGPDIPNVMKFIVGVAQGDTDPLPATLVPFTPIPVSEAVMQRNFELRRMNMSSCPEHMGGMWMINGLHWDVITERPVLGETEIWAWINRSAMSHPMHMHLVSFNVLDRQAFILQGGEPVPTGPVFPPEPNEIGWKDTVNCPPNMITRVISRFEDYPGRFAYHCHILEHEDHEMMRQFETCWPPIFNQGPDSTQGCLGQSVELTIAATAANPVYKWQRDGQPLADGPTPFGSTISGTSTPTLTITNLAYEDAGLYTCLITDDCAARTSPTAQLTVENCICFADFNQDGGIDGQDIEAFFLTWETGDPAADVNQDGGVDGQDVEAFFIVWEQGGCE